MYEPVYSRIHLGGTQKVYRFANGYGASLIEGGIAAYGGREMAVIRFAGESNERFNLTYDTPITDDVIGYLSPDDVPRILDEIAALPDPAEVSA